MKCVKCGAELNLQMIRADGALQCPGCGAVYRKKSASAQGTSAPPDSARRPAPPPQRESPRAEAVRAAVNRTVEAGKSTVDAVRENPNVQKAADACRAGTAKAAAGAAKAYEAGKARVAAQRAAKAAGSGVFSHIGRRAVMPILLALVVLLGVGFGASAIARKSGGASSGIFGSVFESRDSREIKDLMKRLEKAYNAQDVYALLQLYDPTYTDAMFGMMNLLGLKGDAMKSVLPFASQFISQYNRDSGNDAGTIRVRLLDHTVDGSTGTAEYQVDFSFKDGSKDTLTQTADLVRVEDKWYFSYYPVSTGTSDSAQPAAPSSIPVAAGLTGADVSGELYYIKGRKADGKDGWGVINAQGKEIIAPYFADILDFDGNCFAVTLDGKNWGFIDRYGKLVCDYRYRNLSDPDRQGFYAVSDGKKYGVYNPSTEQSVPCQYDAVGRVNENGLFPAKQQGYWGIVDLSGNIHVDFRYQEMGKELLSDRIGAGINRAWGVIDSSGKEIVPLDSGWQAAWISEEGLIFMTETGPAYVAQEPWRVSVFSRAGAPLFHNVYDAPYSSGVFDTYQQVSADRFIIRTQDEGYLLIDGQGNVYASQADIESEFPEPDYSREVRLYRLGQSDYVVSRVYGSPEGWEGPYVYYQIQDLNGNRLLPDWIVSGYDTTEADVRVIKIYDNNKRLVVSSYYRDPWNNGAYPPERNWTRFFSLPDGRLTREASYAMSDYITYAPHEYVSALVFRDQISDKVLITDLDGNILQECKSFEHHAHGNNNYAFLFDGVYYGVLTDQGMVGKGVAYSKVDYDEDTRTFTLQDGATRETWRYNPDRSVTQLS